MEDGEKRIARLTEQISRLYYNRIGVDKAIESMRDQNISAEFVKGIYNKLSTKFDNFTRRFYYYIAEVYMKDFFNFIDFWTSRYLLIYPGGLNDPALRDINIFDIFHNKST
jgi:hypothetical protein